MDREPVDVAGAPGLETILAIDPGDEVSAIVSCGRDLRPTYSVLAANGLIRQLLIESTVDRSTALLLLEYTPPYTLSTAKGGAYTPRQVVDTAIWTGRFIECWNGPFTIVSRNDVKKHLLGRTWGTEALVNSALLERYGGTLQRAKGTKKAPGPLHGFNGHLYAALAVAVTWAEQNGVLP